MGALDVGLDTLFRSELALDGVYTPAGGASVPVRVMLQSPDVETTILQGSKQQQESVIAEIRKSELTNVLKTGALAIGDANYRILSVSTKDPRRAVWHLELAQT